jgi:RNA polymerase sigma-70 factor, Bacteroides expansion family 1
MDATEISHLQRCIATQRAEEAYKKLFLHFYTELLGFAYGYVKQREIAEEIVSDVMMRIWTMEEALLTVNNLKVYLFKSIKNKAINYLLKERNFSSWDIEQIAPDRIVDYATPERSLLYRELDDTIQDAVRALPPKCRMAYSLVRQNGLTYKEVAAIMEISENTVDRHLTIAVKRLSEAVKNYLAY